MRAAAPGPIAGASKQVRSYASEAKASPTEVSSILEQRIRGVQEEAGLAETGRVLSVGYATRPSLVENFGFWCNGIKIIRNHQNNATHIFNNMS